MKFCKKIKILAKKKIKFWLKNEILVNSALGSCPRRKSSTCSYKITPKNFPLQIVNKKFGKKHQLQGFSKISAKVSRGGA